MPSKTATRPPIVVVYGEDVTQKSTTLHDELDRLLPPDVDRAMALSEYDGTLSPDRGGPTPAAVFDDLNTLPFLADRRVVVIRDADKFVSSSREALERYFEKPAEHATLVLDLRSFPSTTKLHKRAKALGGALHECKPLKGPALLPRIHQHADALGKRLDDATAERLLTLVGEDLGKLQGEIEKLALYAADRAQITDEDVSLLVGESREEKIFSAMDAAARGDIAASLHLWGQTLATDKDAPFKAVGGVLYRLRAWITAVASGGRVWGLDDRTLQTLRARHGLNGLRRLLADVVELDTKAKLGLASIETGVEVILVRIARTA